VFEPDVGQAVAPGADRCVLDHRRRQVDAERRPGGRGPRHVAGGLTGAAADVEHPVGGADGGRREQATVVFRHGTVVVVGVGGPVGALAPIPGTELLHVRRVDGNGAGWHDTPSVILPLGALYSPKGRIMSSGPPLTTTSYAILGLLAVKPWTTHELVQQVDRSLRRIWPRAQSKLYEEPKKLVAHGLARATDDPVGRRRRTRYTITAKGRRALAAWLQQPGAGPVLEFEQLLKISFADSGTKADIINSLTATRAWVLDQNEENLATARAYLNGRGAFPQRAALNQLAGRFLTDFYVTVAQWVEWASGIVENWPDDVREAPFDISAAEEGVRLAESAATLLRAGDVPVQGRTTTTPTP